MTKKELENCLKWMSRNNGNKPIVKYKVYGKKFPKNEKAPKVGIKLYEIYGKGELCLWPDAILFVSEPPKGWKKTVIGRASDYVLGEITEDIGNAILEFSSNSQEKFFENISNNYTIFISINSIVNIEGGKGLTNLFFGNSLDIYYKDFEGNEVHSYFFGNKEMPFPTFAFRKSLENAKSHI